MPQYITACFAPLDENLPAMRLLLRLPLGWLMLSDSNGIRARTRVVIDQEFEGRIDSRGEYIGSSGLGATGISSRRA